MNLEAYWTVDQRTGVEQRQVMENCRDGAVLFADLAGFSSLTEDAKKAFNQVDGMGEAGETRGQKRAADFLAGKLNEVYTAFVAEVHHYHGVVIGFSGDGMLCWFEGDGGERAIGCAFAIQVAMKDRERFEIINEVRGRLRVKVAVVAGCVQRFVVGDPDIVRMDVMVGTPVDKVADGESVAKPREVVVPLELAEAFSAWIKLGDEWLSEETGELYVVITPNLATYPAWQAAIQSEIEPWDVDNIDSDGLAEQWVAPAVLKRLSELEDPFFADLRSTVPLFLQMNGVKLTDADSISEFDAYIRTVQRDIHEQGGTVLQLTTGDKGIYLYASFGAPMAYDDNVAQACHAALKIRDFTRTTATVESVKIGLNQGFMWAGNYGSPHRMTYGVLGTAVNMAARLMSKAEKDAIWINGALVNQVAHLFRFVALGAKELKGLEEPMPVSELMERLDSVQYPAGFYTTKLVGRQTELELLTNYLESSASGKGQIIRLEGNPGIGKSHLAAMFLENARTAGWRTAVGLSHRLTRNDAYSSWRPIFRTLLGLAGETLADDEVNEIARVGRWLETRNENWLDRLPLLDVVLGLRIEPNPFTHSLSPKQQELARIQLLVELLIASANKQPLCLLVEDIHWIDEPSLTLLTRLTQSVGKIALCLLVTHRPHEAMYVSLDTFLAHKPNMFTLGSLDEAGTEVLLSNELKGEIEPLLNQLMYHRAHGNPFFTEQLALVLKEEGRFMDKEGVWSLTNPFIDLLYKEDCLAIEKEEWVWKDTGRLNALPLGIPETVNDAVQMRLDKVRPILSVPRAVALVSVVGGEIEIGMLYELLPAGQSKINETLAKLTKGRFIVKVTGGAVPKIRFRHHIIQEVAYEALNSRAMKTLHTEVGTWYEDTHNISADLNLILPISQLPILSRLVHHWEFAGNQEKERIYAGLAGEQAVKLFMNVKAIQLLSRALAKTTNNDEQRRFLTAREEAFDWRAERTLQLADLETLENLARSPVHFSYFNLRRAMYERFTNDYDTAISFAEKAIHFARESGDKSIEASAYQKWGRTLAKQGKYAESHEKFQIAQKLYASLKDPLNEGRLLFDQGNNYYVVNQYVQATPLLDSALAYYEEFDYKPGIIQIMGTKASIASELVNIIDAIQKYEVALENAKIIGWRPVQSVLIGNLGNAYLGLGDFATAEAYFHQAMELSEETQDNYGITANTQALGLTYHFQGNLLLAESEVLTALQDQEKMQDWRGVVYGHLYLGYIYEASEEFSKAQKYYGTARDMFLKKAMPLWVDAQAGLAYMLCLSKQWQVAGRYVEAIVVHIDEYGLDGIEYPGRVCLYCYYVLDKLGKMDEAQRILQLGCQWLEEKAAKISDPILHQHFLNSIPFHKALCLYCPN